MKLLFILLPLLAGCASYLYLPKLAKEDATVIVRCSDQKDGSTQMLVVLLDHTRQMTPDEVTQKRHSQKIAEIELDPECHFTVKAPKTPLGLSTDPNPNP